LVYGYSIYYPPGSLNFLQCTCFHGELKNKRAAAGDTGKTAWLIDGGVGRVREQAARVAAGRTRQKAVRMGAGRIEASSRNGGRQHG
jgi:hypothetical protein